jgi:hypothetical protein
MFPDSSVLRREGITERSPSPGDCVRYDNALEFSQRSSRRSFPEQDELRQALVFDRSHPAFRKRIQVRAARWESQTFLTPCRQGLPEVSAALGVPILQNVATAVQISQLLQPALRAT